MKRIIFILSALLPLMGYSGQITHTESLCFDMLKLSETTIDGKKYVTPSIEGLYNNCNPGKPLLVEGRKWVYRMIESTYYCSPNVYPPDYTPDPEGELVFEIGAPTEIDGVPSHELTAYGTKGMNDYYSSFFLAEDIENHKVSLYPGTYGLPEDVHYWLALMDSLRDGSVLRGEPILLYDFDDIKNSWMGCDMEPDGEMALTVFGTEVNVPSYNWDNTGVRCAFVEGLGIIAKSDNRYTASSSLLGLYCNWYAGMKYGQFPFLYEVIDPDGTVIYHNPLYAPDYLGVDEVNDSSQPGVHYGPDGVHLTGIAPGTDVLTVFDAQGRKMVVSPVVDGEATVLRSTLRPGVYVAIAGTHTMKIVLR